MYYESTARDNRWSCCTVDCGSTEMFDDIMPSLSINRQVIDIDLQAHGRTADIDRPLGYATLADDVAGLIQFLGLGKVDVMGYSVGGEVALRMPALFTVLS